MAAWCRVCEMEIPRNQWTVHIDSKKHKSKLNISRMIYKHRVRNENSGITVWDIKLGLTLETIVNYFKKYGWIVGALMQEDNTAVIQFQDWSSAQRALKYSHRINGNIITLTPRKDSTENSNNKTSLSNDLEDLYEKMEQTKMELEDQIAMFISSIESTEEDETVRNKICASLQQWLSFQYPGCQMKPFGSLVSGLALKGSDLDIFLGLPQGVAEGILKSANRSQALDSHNPHLLILESVSQSLRKHPDVSRLVVIRAARIPVTKFTHVRTGISCDLSIVNETGLRNSHLIRYLQAWDVRIKPYLLFIKYWSHKQKVKDQGLSSYALTLMAIYHLQQRGVLPSIQSLQSQVPAEEMVFINGWNVSFPSTVPVQYKGNASVWELVHQFFAYYAALDVNDVVLCPLLGRTVPRRDFGADGEHLLPDCMELYYQNVDQGQKLFNCSSSLCVQDPFELNFNVTGHFKNWQQLQVKCRSVADLCSAMALCQMPKRIRLLFSDATAHPTVHEISCLLTPLIPLDPGLKSEFLNLISSALVKLLQSCYLIEAQALNESEDTPAKKVRLDDSTEEESARWMFQTSFDLWTDRCKVETCDGGSFVEREKQATLRLAELQGFDISSMTAKPLVRCRASISLTMRTKKKKTRHAAYMKLENEETSSAHHLNVMAAGLRHRWKSIVNVVVKENSLPFA